VRVLNPLASAENHPNCRTNRDGEPLLPTGTAWRQRLLFLALSSKLIVETQKLLHLGASQQTQDARWVRVWLFSGGGSRDSLLSASSLNAAGW
jgi:hypothetical protein